MLKVQITRPYFQFGVPKKHKVATKLISYKRYGEILFQKVVSGDELPFCTEWILGKLIETLMFAQTYRNYVFLFC